MLATTTVAVALLASAVAAGALSQASAAGDEVSTQPPVTGIDFCDFAGTQVPAGASERDCRLALLDPEGAHVVHTGDAGLSPQALAEAAADTPVPPAGADAATPPTPGQTDRDLTDLTDQEAEVVFDETAKPVVADAAAPTLPDNAEVLASSGNGTVVRTPSEGTALIDSSAPLVDQAGNPLDMKLQDKGSNFEPKNPAASVELPAAADGSVALADADVKISYASHGGDASDADGRVVGDLGALYPTVAPDTDLFLAPRATGLELYAQLRSADSPEALRFDVNMPSGDALQPAPDGIDGAQVVGANGNPKVTITPPIAMDGNGDPVSVDLEVDGDSIVLSVPHDASDAYPILVDPVVAVNDIYLWSSGAGFGGWTGTKTAGSSYVQYQNLFGNTGLWNTVPSGTSLTPGQMADWFYLIPHYGSTTSTYISDMWVNAAFSVGGSTQGRPKVAMGEFNAPNGGWVRMQNLNTETPLKSGWLSSSTAWNAPLQQAQENATRADFQLYMPSGDAAITTNSNRSAHLKSAWMTLMDTDDPTGDGANQTTLTGLSGWVDGQAAGYSVVSHAYDGGLGVKTQSFVMGQDADGNNVAGPTESADGPTPGTACVGTATNACPQSWSQGFTVDPGQLRDGLQATAAGVVDAVGHGYINGQWWGVDRQGPNVKLSGFPTMGGGETLKVAATDGAPLDRAVTSQPALAGAQSGVTSVELSIDGTTADVAAQTCDGDGIAGNGNPAAEIPWGSCSMARDFEIPGATYGWGTHQVEIRARDAVGNETVRQATVTIAPEPTTAVVHATETSTEQGVAGDGSDAEAWAQIRGASSSRYTDSEGTTTLQGDNPCSFSVATNCTTMRQVSGTGTSPATVEQYEAPDSALESMPNSNVGLVQDSLESRGFTKVGVWPMSSVLIPGQEPPPGSGAVVDRYRSDDPDTGLTFVWIDPVSHLTLGTDIVDQGTVVATSRWDYDADYTQRSAYSSTFFRVADPPTVDYRESVAMHGTPPVDAQVDAETNQSFVPVSLGEDISASGKHFCLDGVDIVNMSSSNGFNQVGEGDPDPEYPGDDPAAPTTFSAANYSEIPTTAACGSTLGDDGQPDLSVITMAAGSSNADAWRRTFQGYTDNASPSDPENTGNARLNVGLDDCTLATTGNCGVTTDIVATDPGRSSALTELATGVTVIIDAPLAESEQATLGSTPSLLDGQGSTSSDSIVSAVAQVTQEGA